MHLGLIARLIAPALAFSVLSDRMVDWGLADIFWQPALGGPYPLSIPESDGGPSGRRLAADMSMWLATGPFEQLTRAMRTAGGVPEKVLRGNVGSALHGAAEQMMIARPDLSGRTTALVNTLSQWPPLRGTGRVLPSERFQRNSCCLIYRAVRPIPSGVARAVCGDCVLAVG